jgi:hypothetical protein
MAEKIVSPGVFTRENDLSFLSQGIGEIGAAIIGPFSKGPAFVPTVVNTQSEFESIFGTPDGSYYTGYTVQNYLREAGTVTIVRVGHIGGYNQQGTVGIVVSGSGAGHKLVGVLKSTHNWTTSGNGDAITASLLDADVSSSDFVIQLSGSDSAYNTAISASILYTAGNDLSDVFGGNPRGSKGVYVAQFFENAAESSFNAASGSVISLVNLGEQSFVGQDISHASTPWIKSQLISGERHDLFRFHTLGDGTAYNKEYKVSIFNVKAAGETNSTDYATFSVSIRGYADTDRKKSILETYNNINLDPASPNYILKVIGDQNLSIDADGKMTMNGDYSNRSKLVRVEVSPEGSFPIIAGPFGHDAYYSPIRGNDSITPAVIFSTGSKDNTASSAFRYSGIDLETSIVNIDNNNFLAPIPNNASTGSNLVFAFDTQLQYELTGSNTLDITKRQFTIAFQAGFDGCSPTTKYAKAEDTEWGVGNTQGFNLSTSTASGSVAYVKAINSVSNPDDFDINLVVTPGVIRRLHSYVFDKVVDMCEDRQDCFFIGELTDKDDSIALATNEAQNVDSSYVGSYYPWVKTIDSRTNKLTSVPPSVLMPGIYAANDAIAAEWFAPAGLNRGGIIGAVSVLNRLTHAERDTLYENKVNPIAQFPGEGIVAFGQKTLQDKASALDRINVRRLLIKVKKYIASTSRYLVFEQNTTQTRAKFLNTVNPYLEAIQQRQGLYAFRVVMDETNNTPDVIDRNIMTGAIYLQPTKTAEFIVLDFNILPTGAAFGA